MQTAIRRWRWISVPITLWLGAELGAAIWLAGYPELSWLGFCAAAVLVATGVRRRLPRLLGGARS
jgi:hypothetical protein